MTGCLQCCAIGSLDKITFQTGYLVECIEPHLHHGFTLSSLKFGHSAASESDPFVCACQLVVILMSVRLLSCRF